MKPSFFVLCSLLTLPAWAQPNPTAPQPTTARPTLTVEKIMQDPKSWIGTAPSNPFWSEDAKTIYFSWNPAKAKSDSLYKISLTADRTPAKVQRPERIALPPASAGTYNRAKTQRLYEKQGDLFWLDTRTGKVRQLTNTVDRESNPTFSGDEQSIVFVRSSNVYRMNLMSGEIAQITNFDAGSKKPDAKPSEQETWLKRDQLSLFEVLKERKEKKDEGDKITKAEKPQQPKPLYTDGRTVTSQTLSPDGKFVTFNLVKTAKDAKTAIVPSYVTETGFTEDLQARTKVGAPASSYEFFVYDVAKDTAIAVSTKDIPGIKDLPDYLKTSKGLVASTDLKPGPADTTKPASLITKPADRKVIIVGPNWSEDGRYGVLVVRSVDNKDRWLMLLDPATRKLKLLDRQRDEAWVGGPGVSWYSALGTLGWVDNQTLYYQSEADGYAHVYTVNVATGEKKQLTKGKFEVQQAQLSKDKKYFFLTTNEVHPGEQHFYRMAVTGGERVKLTTMTGANDVSLSPDETKLLIRHSYSNQPWELYYAELKTDKKGNIQPTQPVKLTSSLTNEFNAYPWREPAVVTIKARDGVDVYGRLYKPANPNGKAVVFVHGAGYLQNAHKWWSQYFREYMFHNLLADKGYTVLDIDYRASAGYGRDWRTGIYRHMGGKDLTDHVDAAQWLVQNHGIDAKRIGIYGGSYGGFITLMAMFTQPGVFAAGAALRPVTDWAAYNHPYTSAILNEPQADSLAYRRSSPIYFADGLKGHLLICHGMVDVNVHYQDVVRLAQRLIELKKDNWELAAYPVEDHGFVEPTSWTDEYKRILKLFEERL
ncbi:prolyl oligopeptidase family serine peptidase [Nibrella saemangeumensis]|uniref:Prolyl oligopeptidase family serine peptidase n=1 Tax=Nibrella saemangeumensis TaxID=1084526 RepID=A0ABP8MC15_9BACT